MTELIPTLVLADTSKGTKQMGGWEDKEDKLTSAIKQDFRSDESFYKRYDEALQLVSNRHSKGSLVSLVAYLLKENK